MKILDKETERGLNQVHAWIDYSAASGIPYEVMWEWLFHSEPQGLPESWDVLYGKLDRLIRSGKMSIREFFNIATESSSKDTELIRNLDMGMVEGVRDYLVGVIKSWENGW